MAQNAIGANLPRPDSINFFDSIRSNAEIQRSPPPSLHVDVRFVGHDSAALVSVHDRKARISMRPDSPRGSAARCDDRGRALAPSIGNANIPQRARHLVDDRDRDGCDQEAAEGKSASADGHRNQDQPNRENEARDTHCRAFEGESSNNPPARNHPAGTTSITVTSGRAQNRTRGAFGPPSMPMPRLT